VHFQLSHTPSPQVARCAGRLVDQASARTARKLNLVPGRTLRGQKSCHGCSKLVSSSRRKARSLRVDSAKMAQLFLDWRKNYRNSSVRRGDPVN
jgi:hypothetical protein